MMLCKNFYCRDCVNFNDDICPWAVKSTVTENTPADECPEFMLDLRDEEEDD